MTAFWLEEKVADPLTRTLAAITRRGRHALYKSRLYQASLAGRHPNHLLVYPENPFPGDRSAADPMFEGRFTLAGRTVDAADAPPWQSPDATPEWLAEWHSFGWLRHFAAAGGEVSQRHARGFIKAWLQYFSRYDPLAWRPDVLARRQMAWLYHAKLILDPQDLVYRSAVMNTLARQARHLARTARKAPPGRPRLTAAVGLVFSSLCLPYSSRRLSQGLQLLEEELKRQIRADGGYVTRNPEDQFAVLRDLAALRKTFHTAGRDVPDSLQQAIDRMAPMARALVHGDGGLALMNGANEGDAADLKLILSLSESRAKPIADASHSGYQRVQAGNTLVIADAGKPPPRYLSHAAHAAPLSFEMSVGSKRLIVNCGHGARGGEWARASRTTAAHSTLVLGERNACALLANGRIGRCTRRIPCDRQESDGQVWLDMAHDGYQPLFRIRHRRRLYLSADGGDLRGEDILAGPGVAKQPGLGFTVRFHLHPKVSASVLGDGESVVLRVGKSEAWRFTAKGGRVGLEESIYLGTGIAHRTEQIVITAAIGAEEPHVKWSFKRVDTKGAAKTRNTEADTNTGTAERPEPAPATSPEG